MAISVIKPIIEWEMKKISSRRYKLIFSLCFCALFFYYIPRLMLIICSAFPNANLYKLYTTGTILAHLLAYLLGNSLYGLFYYLNHPKIER